MMGWRLCEISPDPAWNPKFTDAVNLLSCAWAGLAAAAIASTAPETNHERKEVINSSSTVDFGQRVPP
jgi:hypothetical protein